MSSGVLPEIAIPETTDALDAADAERFLHALTKRIATPAERWDTCLDIAAQIAVFIPMPRISLQMLLALRVGMVLDSGWQAAQDVPILVESSFLANAEFEPAGERLGVRINGFIEHTRPGPTPGAGLIAQGDEAPPSSAGKPLDGSMSSLLSSANHALRDLDLVPALCFGMTTMPMREVLGLCIGDLVVLDRPVTAPVSVTAGGRVIGLGTLVLVNGCYAVQINEVSELCRHLPTYFSAF